MHGMNWQVLPGRLTLVLFVLRALVQELLEPTGNARNEIQLLWRTCLLYMSPLTSLFHSIVLFGLSPVLHFGAAAD